jgi:hypothetical protein
MFEQLYETIVQMVLMYLLYNRERNTKIGDRHILVKQLTRYVYLFLMIRRDN